MGFGGYGLMGGVGGLGMGFGLLLWISLIVLVVWGVGAQAGPRAGGGETPLEILRRRYAAGEIDRDEFARAREALA